MTPSGDDGFTSFPYLSAAYTRFDIDILTGVVGLTFLKKGQLWLLVGKTVPMFMTGMVPPGAVLRLPHQMANC